MNKTRELSSPLKRGYENIAILGNGPSLKYLTDSKKKELNNFLVIGTNRIIFDNNLSNFENMIFAFHERRLFDSKEFIDALNKTKRDCFFRVENEIFKKSLDQKYSNLGNYEFNLITLFNKVNLQDINSYLRTFPLPEDLLRNVVLDVAIPIALIFKPKEILLFGCDFSYKGQKYFQSSNETPKLKWEHNEKSEMDWSNFSNYRFQKIRENFIASGVKIDRYQVN